MGSHLIDNAIQSLLVHFCVPVEITFDGSKQKAEITTLRKLLG